MTAFLAGSHSSRTAVTSKEVRIFQRLEITVRHQIPVIGGGKGIEIAILEHLIALKKEHP